MYFFSKYTLYHMIESLNHLSRYFFTRSLKLDKIKREIFELTSFNQSSFIFSRIQRFDADFSRIFKQFNTTFTISLDDYTTIMNAIREYKTLTTTIIFNSIEFLDQLISFRAQNQLNIKCTNRNTSESSKDESRADWNSIRSDKYETEQAVR